MKVAICYNRICGKQSDVIDVLSEVELVVRAVRQYKYEYQLFECSVGTNQFIKDINKINRYAPDVIFNLVESTEIDPRLQAATAGVWSALGLVYTGCHYSGLLTTTDKLITKALLDNSKINTPQWMSFTGTKQDIKIPGPWIVKPAWEDASVGINDDAYFTSQEKLKEKLEQDYFTYQQPLLIENFINGREYNVALVEDGNGGVEILPPAEIVFQDWPDSKPRILSYQSKWDEQSPEYRKTIRRFVTDENKIISLKELAGTCWEQFNLNGYARVDFREDNDGKLYVIEINANPEIAPDSGFVAAAKVAGYKPTKIIQKIIKTALRKKR